MNSRDHGSRLMIARAEGARFNKTVMMNSVVDSTSKRDGPGMFNVMLSAG